jgi:type II secretory pathway pseudopilin PulG
MNDATAAVVVGIFTLVGGFIGSAWSSHSDQAVEDKQTASDAQIAALQNQVELQRVALETKQGELNVQQLQDAIRARQEEAIKAYLPDTISDDKHKKVAATIVLLALYPNDAADFFKQAALIASAFEPVAAPSPKPTTPIPGKPTSRPNSPAASAPAAPSIVKVAEAIDHSTGKWTIRVATDRQLPKDPLKGGASFEMKILTDKGFQPHLFATKEGMITTTGVYDSEDEARLALESLAPSLSGRSAFVTSINTLCAKSVSPEKSLCPTK